ncbi:MAG: ABC transporter ATP-binding protein [Thermoplasmata archaeon]|nr:ABC transporter ATP-binding protein [Thermoplasmata archaeon]
MTEPILAVEHLSVDYVVGSGTFHALRDVSFEMRPGRVVGIVGETGCGKSTLAHAIPRLLPEPPARVLSGRVVFQGTDLLEVPRWQLPMVRGTGIGMIFQEPINSLDPAYRVFYQVAEAIRVRRRRDAGLAPQFHPGPQPFDYSRPARKSTAEATTHAFLPSAPTSFGGVPMGGPAGPFTDGRTLRAEVLDCLRLVRINDPETILNLYPHELSGGMRQRVMIAIALSARPTLLIADEPTSALDVTIQAQVLTLMKELMDEVKTSILFISHDLGVIAETADDVGVMYAGHLVEFGPVADVFERPRHPYTKALLRSIPTGYQDEGPLPSLAGSVPNLSRLPAGCTFAPRCVLARPVCRQDPGPPLAAGSGPGADATHRSACHFAEEVDSLP